MSMHFEDWAATLLNFLQIRQSILSAHQDARTATTQAALSTVTQVLAAHLDAQPPAPPPSVSMTAQG